jgi:hypothetical protein
MCHGFRSCLGCVIEIGMHKELQNLNIVNVLMFLHLVLVNIIVFAMVVICLPPLNLK